MSPDAALVVRLVTGPGPDGFWPRENYFGGGAGNGYALMLHTARPLRLTPGCELRLEIANHVPHLPYAYDGRPATVAAGSPVPVLFTWGGKTRLLTPEEIDARVQHGLDPGGETEAPGPRGMTLRQRGRRAGPVLYAGEIVEP